MLTVEQIQLLQQRIVRGDDQKAYKLLFTSLHPFLYSFARNLVKERCTAEEVVSDVFIRLWEKRAQLEKVENLKVYLYVTTRHIALNYMDRQKRSEARLHGYPSSVQPGECVDPEQLLISSDTLTLIRRCIDRLPPQCRLIFKLVKEDGLKYREVAAVLGLSVKTIENQLTIALKKISLAIRFDGNKKKPAA